MVGVWIAYSDSSSYSYYINSCYCNTCIRVWCLLISIQSILYTVHDWHQVLIQFISATSGLIYSSIQQFPSQTWSWACVYPAHAQQTTSQPSSIQVYNACITFVSFVLMVYRHWSDLEYLRLNILAWFSQLKAQYLYLSENADSTIETLLFVSALASISSTISSLTNGTFNATLYSDITVCQNEDLEYDTKAVAAM